MIFLVMLAGHDTTANLIGSSAVALIEHPEEAERLRAEPALMPTAVEELLRYTTPVPCGAARTVLDDVEVDGSTIPKGSKVLGMIISANRDDSVFDRPDDLDLGREPNRHLTFAFGKHFCRATSGAAGGTDRHRRAGAALPRHAAGAAAGGAPLQAGAVATRLPEPAAAAPLVLPVRVLRLHIHPEGSGDGLCGSFQRAKEPITVTPAEIIYRRRLAVLEHAQRSGNVAETCRVFGISRTRYYEWKNRADLYGLDALMPKERRSPQMPSATPTHVLERL